MALLQLTCRITFFADQNLSGDTIPQAVIAASGYPCQKFKDHFVLNTQDVDWLPFVGARGWILLSKDWRMLERESERNAILAANVRAFFFRETRLKGEVMAAILKDAMPKILRAIDRYKPPFVFELTMDGHIRPVSTLEDI